MVQHYRLTTLDYGDYLKNKLAWIQCTQCGNGFEITKEEVDCGDHVDRQACDSCCIGPMIIDWDYPDGPGWKYNISETFKYENKNNK